MAAKCPVVVSNTSSMPEVVNQAGVYFDPRNIDEIRSAIELVVQDEVLRLKLIELGLKNIELFTWEKCAKDTLSLYSKLKGKL
jgi:glycosyltransferase involved in cell wall biosynthesis